LSKRLIAMLFGVLAIAVIAAGCGSSSSEESTSSLTKAEFIKRGDAICAKANKENEAEFEEFAKEHNLSKNKEPSEAVQEEVATTVLLPSVSKQLEDIRALGAPSGEEEQVDEILETVEGEVEEGEEEPSSLLGAEEEEEVSPFAEGNKMAREYGFKVCGQEGE
jgi:hypothetical protein